MWSVTLSEAFTDRPALWNTRTPDRAPTEAYVPAVAFSRISSTDVEGVVSGTAACRQVRYIGDRYHFSCDLPVLPTTERVIYYQPGQLECVGNGKQTLGYTIAVQPKEGVDVNVAVFGDMGSTQSDGTIALLRDELLVKNTSALAIHVGDIAYGDDATIFGPNPYYEPIMDDFMKKIEPIASKVPYMVSPGNHDVSCKILTDDDCDMGLRNFSAYRHRWTMPSNSSGAFGASNLWYAFEYGNIQFVAISTEVDYPQAPYKPDQGSVRAGGFGDQMAWLESVLRRASLPESRAVRPWIVVYGHRPLYSTSSLEFPFDQQERTRKTFEPLFQKFGVDLYIAGHVHMYERTWPMRDNVIVQEGYNNPNSTVYINNGAAGNVEGHCNRYTPTIPKHIPLRNVDQFGIGMLRTKSDHANRTLQLCYDFVPAPASVSSSAKAFQDSICISKPMLR